jgi:hypothetical protein
LSRDPEHLSGFHKRLSFHGGVSRPKTTQ